MKGFREVSLLKERLVSVAVAGGATVKVGGGYIRDNQDSYQIRIRLATSGVVLGGGTLTATLYHAPTSDDTLVSTGKTVTITANGDQYLVVNSADTGVLPLMPYLEVKVVSTGAAVASVDKCGMFKA
jgi:hypothetical protein